MATHPESLPAVDVDEQGPCPHGSKHCRRREVFSSLDCLKTHLFTYHKRKPDVAEWLAHADGDFVMDMLRLSRRIGEGQDG